MRSCPDNTQVGWRFLVVDEMHGIARKLAKFSSLSRRDQFVVLGVVLLLPGFWLGLRLLGFSRLHRRAGCPPVSGDPPLPYDEILVLGTLVNRAAVYTLGANCLSRSLLLQWLLLRRGVEGELRIGVRRQLGQLEAHAWVEVDGRPVNDALEVGERYAAFGEPLSL